MAAALQTIVLTGTSAIRRRSIIAAVSVAAAAILGRWSLRSSAGLAERDEIVVADFENQTGDPVFDGALRQATLSQLGQSRYLNIVSEERIRSVLALMGRASDRRLPRRVAREICQRAGAKAVVAGSIGLVGSRYFISLEAIGCANGDSLANDYEEADSRDRVLTALSKMGSRIRSKLGESLPSVEKSSALAKATTPSIEALQAYSMALHERAIGNDPSALLDRAIELDPAFASAHLAQAAVCQSRGQEAAAEEEISKAYALRERVSERERLSIEGLYHNLVSGDAPQVIAVGRLASRLYPRDATVWGSSVLAYCKMNEFEKALEVGRRQIEVAPNDGVSYVNTAVVLIILGRTSEARNVLEQARARGVGADLFPFLRCVLAALEGDFARIDREAELARGKPFEDRVLMLQSQAAGYFGKLAKVRAIAQQSAERGMSSAPSIAASVALNEAVFGLEDEARDRARAAIRLDHGRRTGAMCALTFALTNEAAGADSILTDLLRRYPRDTLLNAVWPPAVRGAIALARGDIRAAIRLAEAPPHTARFAWPPFIRGSAYLKLGRGAEAAAEFRQIIERKNVQFTSVFTYGAAFAYPVVQLNLARALAMNGQVDASRRTYQEVLAGWRHADQEIPLFKQARAEHAALITSGARIDIS
jgi:tetratricopeptide (TPR) repeat protein